MGKAAKLLDNFQNGHYGTSMLGHLAELQDVFRQDNIVEKNVSRCLS